MRTILEMLSGGDFVSGEAMSKELGISRAAVWKKIAQLKEQGWQIEAGGKRGYRLQAGDSLEPALWVGKLTTRQLGRGEVRYLQETTSTNTEVKQMGVQGAPHGSLCISELQTAGKGRLGRQWISLPGVGLWQSVLLRPDLAPQDAPLVTLCAALAMARAVDEVTGLNARIKWPNDVILNGHKLCGILLEVSMDPDRIESIVVGVGLNVRKGAYPEELADKATCLEECGALPLRRDLLVHYLQALEDAVDALERHGLPGIAEEYRRRSCTLGSRVHVVGAVDLIGTAEDIDETGALLVRTDDGALHRVLSGDVSVRGVMGYV